MSTLKTHNLQSPDSGSVNIAMAPNAGMVVAGLSTYSNQINVGSNIKLGSAGVVTATSFSGSGANLTSIPAGNLTGTVADARITTLTASKLSGALPAISGANLTNLPAQATIANNADNRVITGGSGVNLNGEAGLTYNGQSFQVNSVTSENNAFRVYNTTTGATTYHINGEGNSFIRHTYPLTDSNLDLGYHATNKWRDVVLSGGIRFGSANEVDYLDDYEEGSWTPTIEGLSNTPTYHNRGGIFTKIGNRVWLQGHIQIASTKPQFTSQTAAFKLSGLPFSMSGTAGTGYFGTHGVCLWQQLDWVGSSQSSYGHNDDTQMSPGIVDGGTRISFQTCGQGVYYIGQLLNRAVHDDRAWNLEWTMHYRTAT